jgi:hypothetical protein
MLPRKAWLGVVVAVLIGLSACSTADPRDTPSAVDTATPTTSAPPVSALEPVISKAKALSAAAVAGQLTPSNPPRPRGAVR